MRLVNKVAATDRKTQRRNGKKGHKKEREKETKRQIIRKKGAAHGLSYSTIVLQQLFKTSHVLSCVREPVWPCGKAVGWEAERPRFDSASALLSLQKLWFVDTVL